MLRCSQRSLILRSVNGLTATDALMFANYLFRGQPGRSREQRKGLLTPFVQVGVGVSRWPIADKTVGGFWPSSYEVT